MYSCNLNHPYPVEGIETLSILDHLNSSCYIWTTLTLSKGLKPLTQNYSTTEYEIIWTTLTMSKGLKRKGRSPFACLSYHLNHPYPVEGIETCIPNAVLIIDHLIWTTLTLSKGLKHYHYDTKSNNNLSEPPLPCRRDWNFWGGNYPAKYSWIWTTLTLSKGLKHSFA